MRRSVAAMVLIGLLAACGPGSGERPAAPGAAPAKPGSSAAAPASGPAPGAAAAQRVVIGVPGVSLSYLPAYLASKFGFFEQEGLAVEFVQAGGNVFVPAMLSGDMDFTTNLSSIGAHAGNGGPTKIVQWHTIRLQHVVTVRDGITTPQQLENKRIAVQALGTLPAFEAQKLAEYYGLRNLAMVVAGSELERIAAIEAGAADSAISSIPANLIAESRGMPTLIQVGKVLDIPQAGLGTTDAHLRDKADLVTRTLRAAAHALPTVRERRDEVVSLIADWQEISPADAARAYELVVDTYSPNGLATDAQLASYMELMRASTNMPADAPPERLFDFTIARQIAGELNLPSQ